MEVKKYKPINKHINKHINKIVLPFPLSAAWLLRKASAAGVNKAAVVALHPTVAAAPHVDIPAIIPPPPAITSNWHSLGYLRKKESATTV